MSSRITRRIARRCASLATLATLTLGGLTAPGAGAQSKIDPAWPQWLQEAMSAEHDKIRYKRVQLGPIETVMPGKITVQDNPGDGMYYAVSDDGSGSPVECWFFTYPMDLATLTTSISEAVVGAIAEQHGATSNQQVFHVGAGAIDGAPYLALEWIYTVGEAPETRVAFTKIRAAERRDHYVACAHSQLGYRDSFARSFAQTVTRMEGHPEYVAPYYSEIAVFNMNGLDVGLSYSTMTMDEEGDTSIYSAESMLLPVSSSQLAANDSTTMAWSTPAGEVINITYAEAQNGELVSNLTLQVGDQGHWQVDGSFAGKPISADLGTEGAPLSTLGEMMLVKQLLQDDKRNRGSIESWIPSADPTSFSQVEVEMDPANPGTGRILLGPLVATGEFDDNGSMGRGTIDMGPVKMLIDRVFASGELP